MHTRLQPGQGYTTLEIKVAYHRGMSAATGEVRAQGVVTHLGRRTAYAEAKLTGRRGQAGGERDLDADDPLSVAGQCGSAPWIAPMWRATIL